MEYLELPEKIPSASRSPGTGTSDYRRGRTYNI